MARERNTPQDLKDARYNIVLRYQAEINENPNSVEHLEKVFQDICRSIGEYYKEQDQSINEFNETLSSLATHYSLSNNLDEILRENLVKEINLHLINDDNILNITDEKVAQTNFNGKFVLTLERLTAYTKKNHKNLYNEFLSDLLNFIFETTELGLNLSPTRTFLFQLLKIPGDRDLSRVEMDCTLSPEENLVTMKIKIKNYNSPHLTNIKLMQCMMPLERDNIISTSYIGVNKPGEAPYITFAFCVDITPFTNSLNITEITLEQATQQIREFFFEAMDKLYRISLAAPSNIANPHFGTKYLSGNNL